MLAVGVCNKNLPELIAGHQFHDLFHAVSIQLVEDVIEE